MAAPAFTPSITRQVTRSEEPGDPTEIRGSLYTENFFEDPDPWTTWFATLTVYENDDYGDHLVQAEIATARATQICLSEDSTLTETCHALGDPHLAMAETIEAQLGEIQKRTSGVASVLLVAHVAAHPQAAAHGWRTDVIRYLIDAVGQYGQGILVAAHADETGRDSAKLSVGELASLSFGPIGDIWVRHLDVGVGS